MRRFVFTVATCLLFAGGVSYAQTTPEGEIDWDYWTEHTGQTRELIEKILRIECRGGAKVTTHTQQEVAEVIYILRKDNQLPPYDIRWCHKNGIFPRTGDEVAS